MKQRHSKENTTQTFSLRRPDLKKVMGLLTRQCTLRKHKYRMGIITGNPKSRLCGPAEETAWHAICEFRSLCLRQYQLFGITKLEQNISSNGLCG
jgi:hypothetical protein